MAGLQIQDTTYAGEVASAFIVKSVVGNELVDGKHVYVRDGIKKTFTIPRLTVDGIIQDRVATPATGNSTGNLTVSGRSLTPADYMVYVEFNPRDFEQHWYAVQLNPTLIDRRLPVTAESVIIQEILKQHNLYLGNALIKGDTTLAAPSTYRYFNGLVTRAKADAAVNKVASPVALSVVNIATAFQSVLDKTAASAPALLYDLNMKLFVSYKTAQLWEQYQRSAAFKGVDTTQAGIMRFGGRTIVALAGMPDDTILFAKGSSDMASNLWVGMNSQDDITVTLQKLQANSELYFFKMLMKVDTNYGFSEEIVLYTL